MGGSLKAVSSASTPLLLTLVSGSIVFPAVF